jgi:DNA-binding winged helix-turn-helix (wHTH) protein
MPALPHFRAVRIAARDGGLVQAIEEHRSLGGGWRIGAADHPIEAGALVIVDFDEADERRCAVETIRARGFSGALLVLGSLSFADDAPPADCETLPRPIRLGALLARIDAFLDERADPDSSVLGPYRLSPAGRLLRRATDEEPIRLTELEYRLIARLVEAEGMLVAREQLLEQVWGYTPGVDTHTVETHIWRLRQKIETNDPATHFLVTEPGGYRLSLNSTEAAEP